MRHAKMGRPIPLGREAIILVSGFDIILGSEIQNGLLLPLLVIFG
jgi:hypothetical protein